MSIKFGPGLKLGSKTRSLGQILVKHCVHSGGHSFDPVFVRNFLYRIRGRFEIGSCQLSSSVTRSNPRKNVMNTVKGTVLVQSSWNVVRLFIFIGSRPSSKPDYVWKKLGY